jgi:hypothetical protein
LRGGERTARLNGSSEGTGLTRAYGIPPSRSEAAKKPPVAGKEPVVFIASRSAVCGECSEALGDKAWILPAGEQGALCLACADLDQLVFLPRGDPALTRRARKHSTLSAVVVKWSRACKR